MSRSSNLVYSDDPCSAFIAAIVRSFEQHVDGRHYLGSTAVQKLVYFTKALGVPVPCAFEFYTYGPYSDTVTISLDSMLADDVLKDVRKVPQAYLNYRLGDNADEILSRYQRLIEPNRGEIDTVVQNLGSFKPQDLELIATLHFIHYRLTQIWRKEPLRDQVIEEFYRVKKDKFTRAEIESFYDALMGARLIGGVAKHLQASSAAS